MTSNINYNNIDGTYPVAGVDNDSQGFRSNFTNIKTNFQSAKTELEDLQSKVIVKSALSGTTMDNNMVGSEIHNALIYAFNEKIEDRASVTGVLTAFDYSVASNFSVTPSAAFTISFTSWPQTGQLGRIRVKVVQNSSFATQTMTIPAIVTKGIDSIEGALWNGTAYVISFASAGTFYYEFTSDDGGTSVHINDLSRPRMSTAISADWSNIPYPNFSRYNYYTPSTGTYIFANNTTFIDSTSTIAALKVYLPNSAVDGQIVTINTNNAITSLTISAPNLVLGNVTTLASNSNVKFQFVGVSSPQKWFKL